MLESINYNNINTELSNMYLTSQIMDSILEMTKDENISTIIEDNINIFIENNILNKLAKCVIHNNSIMDVDKFRTKLLEYKNDLKQDNSINSHKKMDSINEAIEILNNPKRYKSRNFKSILSNLVLLESILSICTKPEIIKEDAITHDRVMELKWIIDNSIIDKDIQPDCTLVHSKIINTDIKNLVNAIDSDNTPTKEIIHYEFSPVICQIVFYCFKHKYEIKHIIPKVLKLFHDFYCEPNRTAKQLDGAISTLKYIVEFINKQIIKFGTLYFEDYRQRRIVEYKKLINLFNMVIDKLSIQKQSLSGGEETK